MLKPNSLPTTIGNVNTSLTPPSKQEVEGLGMLRDSNVTGDTGVHPVMMYL